MEIQVQDNGPGLPADQEAVIRQGVGLPNTMARLEQLYGSAYRFELQSGSTGGVLVTVTMPFRTESQATAEEEEQSAAASARTKPSPAAALPKGFDSVPPVFGQEPTRSEM
jgi:hypothetical protein